MNLIPFEEKKYSAGNFPTKKLYEELSKFSQNKNMELFVNKLRTQEYDEEILLDNKFIIQPEKTKKLRVFNKIDDKSKDFDKAIQLHEDLKINRLEEASDPRLWSYLSLVVYRDYICERWDLKSKGMEVTKNRLFYVSTSTKTNSKHALARLWWSVEMTKGLDSKDEYKYTKQILSPGNSQVMFDLIERRYLFRNKTIIKAYLDFFRLNNPKDLTKTSGKMVKFLYNHIKSYDIRFWKEKEVDYLLEDFYSIIKPSGSFFGI